MNELLDNFFKGTVSSAISKTMTAPIELWRIQRQNHFIPNSTLKDVIRKEGIRHLWKGNYVNLVKGTPQYTLNYMIFKEINDGFAGPLMIYKKLWIFSVIFKDHEWFSRIIKDIKLI